jgi:hypothetical protein
MLVLAPTACGGSGAVTGPAALAARFDPRDFPDSATITNPWFPLPPGSTFVFRGQIRGVGLVVMGEVTSEIKRIDGVRARAIADHGFYDGQLGEEARDYYAQDRHGNVWYLGELSTHYVNGKFTDHADTWFGGVKHAKPGIIMPAHPQVGVAGYRQEYAPNISADKGRVIAFHRSVCVPKGCFPDALEIQETTVLDPGVIEDKYYVRGVGLIRSVVVQGDPAESNLVSLTPAP